MADDNPKTPRVFQKGIAGKIEIKEYPEVSLTVSVTEPDAYYQNPDGSLRRDEDGCPTRRPSETIKLEKPLNIGKKQTKD